MNRSSSAIFVRFAAPAPASPDDPPPLDEPPQHERAPALEHLLAGADSVRAVADWRREAFQLIAPGVEPWLNPCAPALHRAFGPMAAGAAYFATPVEYRATMTSVHLPPGGILRLAPAQAAELVRDFNRVFDGGGVRLLADRGAALYCVFDRAVVADTVDPEEVQGLAIGRFQAAGPDAARIAALMSEMEMWLFEHAVNRERARRGERAIGGLWLWGGGATLSCMTAAAGWSAGEDALFGALDTLAQLPRDGRPGVVVIAAVPGSRAWRDAEALWLAPAVEELRAGSIERLILCARRRRFDVSRRWRLRPWRRRRPWWEYLR